MDSSLGAASFETTEKGKRRRTTEEQETTDVANEIAKLVAVLAGQQLCPFSFDSGKGCGVSKPLKVDSFVPHLKSRHLPMLSRLRQVGGKAWWNYSVGSEEETLFDRVAALHTFEKVGEGCGLVSKKRD